MKKVLVINGPSYYKSVKNLLNYSSDVNSFMRKPDDFSLVLFTGGEDVTPELYGDTSPNGLCCYNTKRDSYEQSIFNHALNHNIKMTGICRGLQFLNVMAGGKMMHHLDSHTGCRHDMSTLRNEKIQINSLHHQMVLPPDNAIIIGWSSEKLSEVYMGDKDIEVKYTEKEIESVIYPNINAVGVQYHPEMMLEASAGYKWYERLVNDLLCTDSIETLIRQYTSVGDDKCHVIMSAV